MLTHPLRLGKKKLTGILNITMESFEKHPQKMHKKRKECEPPVVESL